MPIGFDDLVHGPIEFDSANIEDFVIVRSNGTVTYVGKDIAYQLWKFGLLGIDFDFTALTEVDDVVREVAALTPGPYLHLGGVHTEKFIEQPASMPRLREEQREFDNLTYRHNFVACQRVFGTDHQH